MGYGKFYLKEPKTDRLTVIFFSYREKGVSFKYYTLEYINPDQWDKVTGKPDLKKRGKQLVENNGIDTQLNRYIKVFKGTISECKNLEIDLTPQLLRKNFDKEFKIFDLKNSVVDVFDIWMNGKQERQEVTESTLKKYRTHRNNLIRFEQYRQNPDKFKTIQKSGKDKDLETLPRKILKFTDLNKFYDDYVAFARSVRGQNNNSLSRSIKAYKGFLTWAKKNDYTKFSDFENWKIETFDGEIITLTRQELEAMINIDLSETPRLDRARDLFILGCLTGGRFSDYTRITKADLFGETLRIRPIKTGNKTVNIPLQLTARQILEKYEYKLPRLANQNFNKYIKEVAKLLQFNEETKHVNFIGKKRVEIIKYKHELITSHTARKTFVTLSLEAGMRQEVVMKISGHSSYSSFKRYMNITNTMVQNETLKAWDFLNNDSTNLKVV